MREELITFILAMLPISELRGAIPWGVYNNIPFSRVLLLALAGNLLPVIPLYFFLGRILIFMDRFDFSRKFSAWVVARTKRKSVVIEAYKMLGLIVFVGIPLPVTGAWTGTLASVIFKLKFRYFITGIVCGVCLAAIIVSAVTLGFISGARFIKTF